MKARADFALGVEGKNRGYDIVTIEAFTDTFFFEGNENHNGCTMAAKTATCRVLVLPNSTVKLRYDTNGSMYHRCNHPQLKETT